MGRKAGIHHYILWVGAGIAQNYKDIKDFKLIKVFSQLRYGLFSFLRPPFGDEFDDWMFNTDGMRDVDNE